MSVVIRVEATGYEDYVPEDRPMITATFGYGNSGRLQVHLEWSDQGDTLACGWFAISDLEKIYLAATGRGYGNG